MFSQEKPLSEFGRRWNNHNGANSTTDMDSDYRREMAGLTSGTTGVHHEARGRDGGASTLQRRHRVRGARPGDSSADASPVAGARYVRTEMSFAMRTAQVYQPIG